MNTIVASSVVHFAPFQLDHRAGQLRHGATPVPLRPKTFAVLKCLAARPGELVTKRDLLDAVWADVAVTEDVVRISVRELRAALGDQRAVPRFIETVPRRGYRFIAQMSDAAGPNLATAGDPRIGEPGSADALIVGRAHERAEIARWLATASSGRRQIGFVTGEAGIGKTTLVDGALRDLARAPGARLRVAQGQCVEQYGGGEAYMPVVEALAGLCRGPEGPSVEATLRDHAPAWLLSATGGPRGEAERSPSPHGAAEPAPEHSLTKLAASLERLAADTPLVLVLEDVHWSDCSTLDLLSLLAQRREPARLLVLCTLRPADAIVYGHPVASVKRELLRKGLCREILLEGLSAADVARYLEVRFADAPLPDDLLPLIVDRSEGSPFFMVALVDHLLEQSLLVARDGRLELRGDLETLRTTISDRLLAIIEPRLERLSADEVRVLEAASVVGAEFAAHAVAGGAPAASALADIEVVEHLCDALASRNEILRAAGETVWPDGTASARYAFRHALYQQVVHRRLSTSTRRRLHQTVGEVLENAYRDRTTEVASELAVHFEQSRDAARAFHYRRQAAAQATFRSAYREARLHLEAALTHLHTLPETAENVRREMACLEGLGQAIFAIDGYGAESGARVFARMHELAERLEGAQTRLHALEGELAVHLMRAEFEAGCARGRELLALAEQLGDTSVLANAHMMLSTQLYSLGEVERSLEQAERGLAVFDPAAPPSPADLGIIGSSCVAIACACLGRVTRAYTHARDAIGRAAALGIPFQRALAANIVAGMWSLLDDHPNTRAFAEESMQIAEEHDFSFLRVTSQMLRASCDVAEGRAAQGLADMLEAFAEYGTTGQRHNTSYYCGLLARAHLACGDVSSAQRALADGFAFAAETGERVYAPELHRVQGECFLASDGTRGRRADAVACFEQAIASAAAMKSTLLELRAMTSLARLRGRPAHARLVQVVERFEQGADCADLRAARALL